MLKYMLKILTLVLTISLLFVNTFLTKSVNYGATLIIIIVALIASFIIFGYRRVDRRDFKYKLLLVLGLTFLLQSMLYLIATKSGYSVNYSSIFKHYIPGKIVLYVFLITIVRELIRYLVVNTNTNKKIEYYILQALLIIMCVIVDLSIATKVYTFSSFTLIYEFISMFLIPSVAKNILLSYLSKIGGYVLTFAYVLIMDLYIYVIPVKPDLNMLLNAVVLLVFPYLVYNYISKLSIRRATVKKKEKKKNNKIINILSTIVFIILVCLVSREFKYSMIGIGSGSMTGTVNKGDAIIYRKYEQDEDIKDKVIVFRRNNVMIVHRVIKSYIMDGDVVYQTKGDANESQDNWLVEKADIIGIVEYRIPFIAWPSVLLGELF